jgi:thiamine-monophosphate kinase
MRLEDRSESGLIQRIRERFRTSKIRLGIGDDAAILDIPAGHSVVYCSDLVAENTHFVKGLHPADAVGYKAVAVNASDVGAMGGVPMYFLISLAAPGALEAEWVDAFYTGVEKACRDFDVVLAGGDTSSAASIFVDVSMVGSIPAGLGVTRSGAKVGDGIYVTGKLGGSALGLELLRAGKLDAAAVQRHLYPQPRHRVGAAVRDQAHAMIDVSDGLSTDLGHIVEESGVSAKIYQDKLPAAEDASDEHVLHGGEEYELLITATRLPEKIEGVSLTRIGEVIESAGGAPSVYLVDKGVESILKPQGWDHYRQGQGDFENGR